MGFMSTTDDREVALQYAEGDAGLVLSIRFLQDNGYTVPYVTPAVPRMPRLLVVIDTNELLRDHAPVDRSFLLQGFAGCDVVLPAQVTSELDGLKRSSDASLAARARQANALLSEAAQSKEAWLCCEPKEEGVAHAAGSLSADEKVLRCATGFAQRVRGDHANDRVVLATSDRNLRLRAAAEAVDAMPLADVRRQAQARHEAWRAAYAQKTAEDAIAAARWSNMPSYGPFLPAR